MESAKVSFRCKQDQYERSREKAEQANMTYSEYINYLIDNDLRDNGSVLHKKAIIQSLGTISTYINHLAESYPEDGDVRGLKEETRKLWPIL